MKQILFIEDDPVLGPVYETQLRKAGYAVSWAMDGEAGLNALQMARPDLIVLDLMLPRISGLELLQIIRGTAGTCEIPIIVFTNFFQEETLLKVRQIGVDRVLSKSQFVPREVVSIIGEVLDSQGRPAAAAAEMDENAAELDEPAFRNQVSEALSTSRRLITEIAREQSIDVRLPLLRMLRTGNRKLASLATSVNSKAQAYFCEAFDALLDELVEQPDRLTGSSMRTITQAVDFLQDAFDADRGLFLKDDLTFRVLVVDDDPLSRRAIQVALARIKLSAVECSTASEALEACGQRNFDLVFADVDMPGMSGYDLCEAIRRLESNRNTPVVFVTRHTDLQTRAHTMLSGGNDFIGKPFHFMELALKTLLLLMRSRMRPAKAPETAAQASRTA